MLCVPAFRVALEFVEVRVFEERGKPEYRGENRSTGGKTSRSRERTNNKLSPHMVRAQNRTRATSVGGECASPAPRDAVMPCRWGSKPQEFGVKRVDEEQIIIVTRIQSWHFERWPFVRAKNI